MEFALIALLSFTAGAALVHFIVGSRAKAQEADLATERRNAAVKSEALARAEAERDALDAQLKQLAADRESLKESFAAISSEQLKANRDELLKQAGERFEKTEERHKHELEKRHEAIEAQFKGMGESLDKFRELQRAIEEERKGDFGMLRQRLKSLHEQTEHLGRSTTGLSTALRGSSQSRGRWGEMALRNIVEAAGMTEHCDFIEQTSDDAGTRPDLVVKLPGDTRIPIDSKVPYSDYERMVEEEDPAKRQEHLKKHGDTVNRTMLELSKRRYHDEIGGEIDYTVMFIPIESVAAAAFEARPELQMDAMKNGVLITTPVTLIALLRTVGLYWKQERMAKNAQEIWNEATELHNRLGTFHDHLGKVGKGLNTAVKSFNSAVGSFESRVIPQGRRIEELSGSQEAARLSEKTLQIESQTRDVNAPSSGEATGDEIADIDDDG